MWKQKLCMAVTPSMEVAPEEQIELLAKAGFDAFFTAFEHTPSVASCKKVGDSFGMTYQSIHAPFHGKASAASMWSEGDAGKIAANELCKCLEVCSDNEIGIMVAHTYIGFKYDVPNDITKAVGLENFGKVVRRAAELGIKVAFENTEGEEFLDTLMSGFKNESAAGFCWDTGHEQCYNFGRDMLSKYGDKLIALHINDNLGVSDFGGTANPKDDLHLLPFDGITDWSSVAERLDRCGFSGIMTFELKRRKNDAYTMMSNEMYISEAYKRACRLAHMRKVKQI